MATSIPINFFVEDIEFKLLKKAKVRQWIKETIENEGFKLKELNFIFCSDAYLLQINQQYLDHDTYTDIITFDNSDSPKRISGDIFISVDRVNENALAYKQSPLDELHRVIIHGTLHLLGYPDKGKTAKQVMTARENLYLSLRKF